MEILSRVIEMESKSWTAGTATRMIFQCINLQKRSRVLGFWFKFEFAKSAGAGGGAIIDWIGAVLSSIVHNSDFLSCNLDGFTTRNLNHAMHGRALFPQVSGAGNVTHTAWIFIPCQDTRALDPADQGIPSECFAGTSFELEVNGVTAVTAVDTIAGTQTVRMFAVCEPSASIIDPFKYKLAFEDWAGQTLTLRRGAYTHLFVQAADGAAVTQANLTFVSLNVDGRPILANVRTEALAAEFNRCQVAGGFQASYGTLQALNEQLQDVSGAATVRPFLPVYTPPPGYLVSKVPMTPDAGAVTLQLTGTLTAPRVVYRVCEYKGEMDVRSAWQKQAPPGQKDQSFTRILKTLTKTRPPPAAVMKGNPALAEKWASLNRILPGSLFP